MRKCNNNRKSWKRKTIQDDKNSQDSCRSMQREWFKTILLSPAGSFPPGWITIKQSPELIDPLSEREREVLRCIIQGMKNSEIAESLFLSSETIKSHVSTTIQKLGVRDRTQAAVFALTHGLVEVDI